MVILEFDINLSNSKLENIVHGPQFFMVSFSDTLVDGCFSALRSWSLVNQLGAKQIVWCVQNRSHFDRRPIFWITSPSLKKYYPQDLELLDAFGKSIQIEKPKKIRKYIVNSMEKQGACHGQCLALIELRQKYSGIPPEVLLSMMKRNPTRLAYFQTLEIIRSQCLEMQNQALEYFPKPHIFISFDFPALNLFKKEMIDKENAEGMYLVRYWNEKTSMAHSMVYVQLKNEYWFYDCRLVGLYTFNRAEDLYDCFVDHLKAFFSKSNRETTHLIFEQHLLQTV